MHVAHLLRKYNPAQWGGTETALQRLLEGLRNHEMRHSVYCPKLESTTPPPPDPLTAAGHRVTRYKAHIPLLGANKTQKELLVSIGGNLVSFDLIWSLHKENKLDLIHSHCLGRLGGAALMVAKKRKIPCVVTIHGGALDLPLEVIKLAEKEKIRGFEWGKLYGFMVGSRHLLRDADAVIACNEKEANLLREKYPHQRVKVQPHGIPYKIYQPDYSEAAYAAYPQLRGRDIFITVARVDPVKNQAWLIDRSAEILRKYPNATFVFVGGCTHPGYGKSIEKCVRENNLQKNFLLTGGIPPGDPRLIGLLQQSKALILPSLSETFGLVIIESWACGTVVLSNKTSGACSLVEHGKTGWLFDVEDPKGFHEVLDCTMQNQERRREILAAGREKVQKHYDTDVLAERMKQLYDELIEKKNARRNPSRR
jgi:alpha-maltose-1-phosphate synthase